MTRFLLHAAVTLGILAVMIWPSVWLADMMARRGVFGSCFEGACGYGALFVGFPIAWAGFSAFGIGVWIWWWRRISRGG